MPRVFALAIALLFTIPQTATPADGPRYGGTVHPLVAPMLLRYGPTDFLRNEMVSHHFSRGSTKDSGTQYVVMEGPVVVVGESLEMKMSFWLGENELLKLSSDPLNASIKIDRRGNWTSINLSGKNPIDGSDLKKGTPFYEGVEQGLVHSMVPYPVQPVRQGDNILAEVPGALRQLLEGSLPANADISGDIKQFIVGETILNGRRGIVTDFHGQFRIKGNGQTVRGTVGGYSILDVETGFKLETRVAWDFESETGGYHVDASVTGFVR